MDEPLKELPQDRWFWVWLTIFSILLGASPFIIWDHRGWGITFGVAGLAGFLILVRDRLALAVSRMPLEILLKALAVVALSILAGQLIAYGIYNTHANGPLAWSLLAGGILIFTLAAIGISISLIRELIGKRVANTPKKSSKLVIHWANYRAVDGSGEVCEVGEFLRQIISGDSLVFDVENHNFVIGDKNFVPNDPSPFKEKRLQVNYSYGGQQATTTERREHGRLLLPEDSKIKWLASEVDRLKAAQLLPVVPKITTLSYRFVDEAVEGYPLKVRIHLRNDSTVTVDLQVHEYRPELVTVKRFPTEVLQLRLRDSWYPKEHGAGRIALYPGQQFEAWIAPDEAKFTKAQVETYRGRIGTLVLLVNGQHVEIKL